MSRLSVPAELERRRAHTTSKLRELGVQMEAYGLTEAEHPRLALFATGSLGRRELGSRSDLDVFLVDVAEPRHRQGNLNGILLRAKLIQAADQAGFEEFSGDGRYLTVHNLEDLLILLGTREEDSRNVFTARMLLLLESLPLIGEEAYNHCVQAAIGIYSRDAGDAVDFRPQFLINDIVRYWKTLCLSYESSRHDLHDAREQGNDEQAEKMERDGRVNLLKLRFNRLWMCFNGLAYLLLGVHDDVVRKDHVERLIELAPLDRAIQIADELPDTEETLQEMLDLFAEFLTQTDADKAGVLAHFSDPDRYQAASAQGRRFGDLMGELINTIAARAGVQRFLLL